MKRVLIYIDKNALKESLQLLEVARKLYSSELYTVYGFYLGIDIDEISKYFDYLVGTTDGFLSQYEIGNITSYIKELHDEYKFDVILFLATNIGRMLAPRVAMRLHAGLVADVTSVQLSQDQVEMERPAFSGRLRATVIARGDGPVMMTIRPNAFVYENPIYRSGTKINFTFKPSTESGITLLIKQDKPKVQDIRESKVLISGGGGILRNFNVLEDLAKALHGMVSASRKVVDTGEVSRSIQVGQSGKIVSPQLYMALGISGSIQHIVGLKNVEHVISVNTNRDAPICSMSDIVVEGDAKEFVERLVERINRGS